MFLCMYHYVYFVCYLLVMDSYLSSLTLFFPFFFASFFLPYILMVVQEEGIKAYVHLQSWYRKLKILEEKFQTCNKFVKIPKCPLLRFPKCLHFATLILLFSLRNSLSDFQLILYLASSIQKQDFYIIEYICSISRFADLYQVTVSESEGKNSCLGCGCLGYIVIHLLVCRAFII